MLACLINIAGTSGVFRLVPTDVFHVPWPLSSSADLEFAHLPTFLQKLPLVEDLDEDQQAFYLAVPSARRAPCHAHIQPTSVGVPQGALGQSPRGLSFD